MAERTNELDSGGAARRHSAVHKDEMPGREPPVRRQRVEERARRLVLEREQRDPAVAVERRDVTRREAAEPSSPVVEDNRPRYVLTHTGAIVHGA